MLFFFKNLKVFIIHITVLFFIVFVNSELSQYILF